MVNLFVAEQPRPYDIAPKARDVPNEHQVVLLDSCVWIYHFEDHPQYADLIDTMLTQWIAQGTILLSSELSLLEIKAGPLRLGEESVVGEYQLYLNNFPGLYLVPIERAIIDRAARLRAHYRLKTPDALILATGLERGATLALTNDRAWKAIDGIEVVCLMDLIKKRDEG
uniref:Predicted nucleic acid-binding protein, contains PIN domain n=1 Tax=Candidatus Kentrum sp. FW TaxID=2126338 RepID=A0A450SFQ8_9GAMM|nr:MAG: Predicted nucleic acid-binding protein, contains PIN domain [Candidatus Kentron sp. FW]VFJ51716.1 MAG: Predicted nucleic acid-binding protein, contains PIN domain [Candidatus Kentron sp. FW]